MSEHSRLSLDRRRWLALSAAGVLGPCRSGWLENLARAAAGVPRRARSCILLWMNGGPSQMDTFDLKPGHKNGGPIKEIATSAPGLRIGEHLPRLAKFGHRLAVVRSMTSKEGDHDRATQFLQTGYLPQGGVDYPALGALVARERGREDAPLPPFVSIAPGRDLTPTRAGAGFLDPEYNPLFIAEGGVPPTGTPGVEEAFQVRGLRPSRALDARHAEARVSLLRGLETDFAVAHPDTPARSHRAAYERAVRLLRGEAGKAFRLEDEKAAVRDAYGRNLFGQGCLLARRLVERGVPFVEVNLGGNGLPNWDTHANNFAVVRQLCELLDPAWSALMNDLQERGLLDSTLIVWMGEFGRTPQINGSTGRDHYPNAWTAVLGGGGIVGGQAVGKTSKDGTTIEERPVSVPDLLGTVCQVLEIDPDKQNLSDNGRPIRIVDKTARPLREVLG